ncbi:MAG: helix-turn-helix domain-containing protein [Erysipelotrichaceae bacterium]|nr:helix-turn-helix domain-containing protein [Erysipelotrichaceae bacterium]
MNKENTGKLISQLRKEKNLTQAQLAEMIYVSDKAVSRWETGRGFPDIGSLEALAKCLDISEVELLRGERAGETITSEELKDISAQGVSLTRDYINRRRLRFALIGFLLALIVLTAAAVHLNSPRFIPYEKDVVSVEELSDGRLLALCDPGVSGCDVDVFKSADNGRNEAFIGCYQTLWDKLTGKKGSVTVLLGENDSIDDVYYYPGSQSDVLLYSRNEGESHSYSVTTMPRMIYHYWLVIGLFLTVVGMLMYLLFRKRYFAKAVLKAALLPAAFTLAIVLTLWGHFSEVYNAPYYLSGIVLLGMAIWLLAVMMINNRHEKARPAAGK